MSDYNFEFFSGDQRTPAWEKARKGVLTASWIPDLLGYGFKAWMRCYTGAVEPTQSLMGEAIIQRGVTNEPRAVEQFTKELTETLDHGELDYGAKVLVARPGLLIDKTLELGASLDGLVCILEYGAKKKFSTSSWYNLEVKCPNPDYGLPTSITDLKPRYLLQILAQMKVAKLPATYLYFWISPTESSCFLVTFNNSTWELLEEYLPEIRKYFFNTVQPRPKRNPFLHDEEFSRRLAKCLGEWKERGIIRLWPDKVPPSVYIKDGKQEQFLSS